jgi:hypothetical protein
LSLKGERSGDVTPGASGVPSPHPFAIEIGERVLSPARVLLLGVGSGRNVPPLLAAGLRVDAVESDPSRAAAAATRFAAESRVRVVRSRYEGPLPFAGGHAAALSTHALLHGTRRTIAATVRAARDRLGAGAPFYATLGSQNDPRFGTGTRIDDDTFAPLTGAERGVAHTYVTAADARALFADFVVESLEEVAGGESVGRWAHDDADAATIVHWYVRARRAG